MCVSSGSASLGSEAAQVSAAPTRVAAGLSLTAERLVIEAVSRRVDVCDVRPCVIVEAWTSRADPWHSGRASHSVLGPAQRPGYRARRTGGSARRWFSVTGPVIWESAPAED